MQTLRDLADFIRGRKFLGALNKPAQWTVAILLVTSIGVAIGVCLYAVITDPRVTGCQ